MTSVKAPTIDIGVPITRMKDWMLGALDHLLNRIFALRHTAAHARSSMIGLLFFVLAIIFIITSRTVEEWSVLLPNFLSAVLLPTQPLPNNQTSTEAILNFLGAVLFNPGVWAHLIAVYAPFWLMHRITAIYLADVFEKDEDVAHRFISQAAFASDYTTVRIREGKIVEADQSSPIVQIGGPGYVVVELDSAALFERPDGSAHIIPPTVSERRGRKVVEGFERIRQAADLREIHSSQEVSARSRDGIPVVAKDIQYSYSIYRGENPSKTLQTPYPFSEKAMENLTYKLPRPVKPGATPSAKPDWLSPLPGKIAGPILNELGSFVSKRGLSEFLSSIGAPEEDALRSREDELDRLGQQLSGRNGSSSGEIFFKPAQFASRSSITAMFYDEEGFKKRAAERGFQLNWIGIGTWVTPAEIIPANHLEAWKLSRENFARNNPEQLKRLQEEARLQESLQLIQTMPVAKFYNDLKQSSDNDLIDSLIGDYYERMQSAMELYEREGQEAPYILMEAIRALNQVREIKYHSINDDEYDDVYSSQAGNNNRKAFVKDQGNDDNMAENDHIAPFVEDLNNDVNQVDNQNMASSVEDINNDGSQFESDNSTASSKDQNNDDSQVDKDNIAALIKDKINDVSEVGKENITEFAKDKINDVSQVDKDNITEFTKDKINDIISQVDKENGTESVDDDKDEDDDGPIPLNPFTKR